MRASSRQRASRKIIARIAEASRDARRKWGSRRYRTCSGEGRTCMAEK